MLIFILTGAGVSAESGLGTFRDANGTWSRYDLAEVATPEGFATDPGKVWAFYSARRDNLRPAKPNPAHAALARLEHGLAARGHSVLLVTQNVDCLHEQAGSQAVVHMHGELMKSRCAACAHVFADEAPFGAHRRCPACGQGRLRPHVVWFGEEPLEMDRIAAALAQADVFVAIGTSGQVYPAAGFVRQARAQGTPTLEINLEPSDAAGLFDRGIYGPATVATPAWVEEVLHKAHPTP